MRVVKNTPLISIDLLIRSPDNALLMGLRLNEPAAGFWFVPGGRIYKNECLDQAFMRISKTELGLTCTFEQARLLGAFTHKYKTNFMGTRETGTHYVVLAYDLQIEFEIERLPKEQHRQYRWIFENDKTVNIHKNAQAYFDHLPPS